MGMKWFTTTIILCCSLFQIYGQDHQSKTLNDSIQISQGYLERQIELSVDDFDNKVILYNQQAIPLPKFRRQFEIYENSNFFYEKYRTQKSVGWTFMVLGIGSFMKFLTVTPWFYTEVENDEFFNFWFFSGLISGGIGMYNFGASKRSLSKAIWFYNQEVIKDTNYEPWDYIE